MIWALEGAFGSGKTLSMVKFAREFLRYHSGDYQVVTNTPFTAEKVVKRGFLGFNNKMEPTEVTYIEKKDEYFEHFKTDNHTLFLLDEGGVWLNNYNWKVIPEDVYDRFTQVRKADIHFIYTVRHFAFVANKLRMMTDAVINCKPIPRVNRMSLKQPRKPWVIVQTFRDVEYYEKEFVNEEMQKKYTLGRRWVIRMGDTIRAFDTNKIIKNERESVPLESKNTSDSEEVGHSNGSILRSFRENDFE